MRRCLTSESELVLRDALWRSAQLLPLQLSRKRKSARPAARATHPDQDALLLLIVEVGAVEHDAGLLLKQLMQGQVAGHDLILGDSRPGGFIRFSRCPGRLFAFWLSLDAHFATFFM
jgi:hypothetical protein